MKNTYIKQIAFATIMGLFLSACVDDKKTTPITPITPSPEVKVPQCGTELDKGKALASDVTGKTIKKVDVGAKVRIWDSADGTKRACMISGKAIILSN